MFISLVIGISLGAIAGYFGGRVDTFIMWIINITWSIPTLLLVIAITLALGKGYWQVFIAVGLTMWVEVARVVRGQVMSTKQQPYIEATKALGFSSRRIIFRHILPNIIAPVIVISAANFAAAILIESGLSFLGIGAQPPTPSWGAIIKNHYNYMILGKPHLAMIPGLAIMSLVMAFMLIGNTLRDALDVKQKVMSYTLEFNTKWADFDANRHMRHTAYNDYAAEVRIRYFTFAGFSVDRIAADGFGLSYLLSTPLLKGRFLWVKKLLPMQNCLDYLTIRGNGRFGTKYSMKLGNYRQLLMFMELGSALKKETNIAS